MALSPVRVCVHTAGVVLSVCVHRKVIVLPECGSAMGRGAGALRACACAAEGPGLPACREERGSVLSVCGEGKAVLSA